MPVPTVDAQSLEKDHRSAGEHLKGSLEKRRLQEDLFAAFQVSEGGLQESWNGTSYKGT